MEESKNPYLKIEVITMILWCVVVMASLFYNMELENQQIIQLAKVEAKASYHKDITYRRWASLHGGVYVPITDTMKPNPHLSFLKDRDVVTTNGKRLTLVNPAFMTRQVYELGNVIEFGVKGHITSLNPIRMENAPDAWESNVLSVLTVDSPETNTLETIAGLDYLRYMKVMLVEESCLKCHGQQGYQVGEIRGGISVSVPMKNYHVLRQKFHAESILSHVVIMLVGLGIIIFGSHHINRYFNNHCEDERLLRENEKKLVTVLDNLEIKINEEVLKNRKKDEALIIQSRFAAMGEMILNIAHQWRQPMASVGLIVQNIYENYKMGSLTEEKMRDKMEKAMALLKHMSETIDDFRQFSYPSREKEEIFIPDLILKTMNLVNEHYKNIGIPIEFTDKSKGVHWVKGFSNELSQVILNIINNAKDQLVIKEVIDPKIEILYEVVENKHIITISDNGGGIDPMITEKIYEPYFSTKERGAGIGLYMSKMIVEMRMNGTLEFRNIKGGVNFIITICTNDRSGVRG